MSVRYFEDLEVGSPEVLGRETVTAEGIRRFAGRYDPPPVDPDGEATTTSDEPVASGFYAVCLTNRIVVEEFRRDIAAIGGLGTTDLRWRSPVRPGDTLVVHHELAGKRVSESDPRTGVVDERVTVTDDRDEPVASYASAGLVERRSHDEPSG